MQPSSTNRMRVFSDEEIGGINELKTLTEAEVGNVSGGLILIVRPSHFPFPFPGPTCPTPFPGPFQGPFPGPFPEPFPIPLPDSQFELGA